MPYYIYQISEFPLRQLKLIGQHDSYREASASAKQLRISLAPATIKMIHAESELHAEDLLNQVRESVPVLGDD